VHILAVIAIIIAVVAAVAIAILRKKIIHPSFIKQPPKNAKRAKNIMFCVMANVKLC
jgi:uncharacterized protein YneF (UPF0154 family)